MLTGKTKLYFLLNHIENVKVISPSGEPLSIDPLNDLNNRLSKDDLSKLFIKLEKEEKIIKLIKAPMRVKNKLDYLDPYDHSDDGCWHIELSPTFDRYFLEIQQESEYQEFIGKKPSTQQKVGIFDLSQLHPAISQGCEELYSNKIYPQAVEMGFKIVKDKLRDLTGYESGSDAFGNVNLHIKGAAASNVDKDFNKGVQHLAMAIDRFRNEKTHTSKAKIDDPKKAYEYLVLSSLVMHLLDEAEITLNKQ